MSQYRYNRKKYSFESGLLIIILGFGFAIYNGSQSIITIYSILIAIVVIILVAHLIYKKYRYDQLSKTGIFDIDTMIGSDFEERLMVMFKHLGYNVKHVGKTADAGVDLIIEKDGKKTAIQAKRYQSNVGEAAVQQVHTGKHFYHCDDAIIVSNSNYTEMARKVAKETDIKLWSRNDLIKSLQIEHNSVNHSDDISPVNEIDPHLTQFITDHMAFGEQWPDIKTKLLQVGWKEEKIDNAYFQISRSKLEATNQPTI
jgi:restriction system protein